MSVCVCPPGGSARSIPFIAALYPLPPSPPGATPTPELNSRCLPRPGPLFSGVLKPLEVRGCLNLTAPNLPPCRCSKLNVRRAKDTVVRERKALVERRRLQAASKKRARGGASLPPASDAAILGGVDPLPDAALPPSSDAAVVVVMPPLDAAVAVPDPVPHTEGGPAEGPLSAPLGEGQPSVPSGEAPPPAAPLDGPQAPGAAAAVVQLAGSQQPPQGGGGAPVVVKTPGSTEGEGLGENGEPRPADVTDVLVLAGSALMWQLLRARCGPCDGGHVMLLHARILNWSVWGHTQIL